MNKNHEQLASEQQAEKAFSRQSSVFDTIYSHNKIIQYKRERVRTHVNKYLNPNSNILELNSGTGEDTIYFAQQGHHVHATDISVGMQNELSVKVKKNELENNISTELCSFTELTNLKNKGPYHLVFSNFAGLNCTNRLSDILKDAEKLLVPGGIITMVLLPPFCLWETLQALRGQFKLAFRRFNSKNGVKAHIEGVYFTCWYYKQSFIINEAKNKFDILDIEGLCTIVPPSYFEHFADKHPRTFNFLCKLENRLKNKWPWKKIGDYYIISLRKK